jgi:hypothetical protein
MHGVSCGVLAGFLVADGKEPQMRQALGAVLDIQVQNLE